MPKISVIVPVYNVEKYLHRCVDSILAQTFTDFELILVDDGSPDNCGKICDEYAEKDSRVIVIHKENGGVSSARNAGLEVARGEFIAFVDADDFISKDFLEVLLLSEEDLSIASVNYVDKDGKFLSVARKEENLIVEVYDNNILQWYEHGSLYSVWTSLFRKSIIEEEKIRFDTNTTRGEDTIFMFQYVENCKKVRFSSSFIYNYVMYGKNGSSSSTMNIKNIYALNYLDCFIKEWLKDKGLASEKFNNADYWTKKEQKEYFWSIFIDNEMPLRKKYHLYRIFYSLSNFRDNIEEFFKNESSKMIRILKLKSPLVLCIFDFYRRTMKK